MKSIWTIQSLTLAAALLFFASQARAQTEAEKTYKAKCVACHAADGSGSQVGQKLGTHDFHSSQVQGETEAEIEQIIAKGKNKMPAYEKTLKSDEIRTLAAYVKELGGKK
ncbi:MAG TPA: cytochrome c [Candidatus Acidoferrales bacterium]|jgi:mono/diheme cytochrome c family protein|nr:cytochrome c [Candidatus Acidoferrales bacterium]